MVVAWSSYDGVYYVKYFRFCGWHHVRGNAFWRCSNLLLLLGRVAHSVRSSSVIVHSVGPSVCPLVTNMHCYKASDVIGLPFGGWDDPKELCAWRMCTLAPPGKYGRTVVRSGYIWVVLPAGWRRGLFPNYFFKVGGLAVAEASFVARTKLFYVEFG